jgi:hypothetical protein
MTTTDSRVIIHMAASLDGFVARKDGRDMTISSACATRWTRYRLPPGRLASPPGARLEIS